MANKKKINQENNHKETIINKLLHNIEIKYADFVEYFDEKFYENIKINLLEQIHGQEVDGSIQLGMRVDNLVLKYLCDQVRNDNVDIEILLVDKFMSTLRLIKRTGKLKGVEEFNDEDILMEAIESYYGNETFSLHLNACLRKMVNKDKKEDFLSKVKRYAFLKDNESSNIINTIIRILDIYEIIPESEELLKKFIYLKYGYFDECYFNLEEISAILEIDMSLVIDLYRKSLVYAKEIGDSYYMNLNLEQIKCKIKSGQV